MIHKLQAFPEVESEIYDVSTYLSTYMQGKLLWNSIPVDMKCWHELSSCAFLRLISNCNKNILPGNMINKRVDYQMLCQPCSHVLTDSLSLIPSALANLAAGGLMSTNFKSTVMRFHAKRQKWPQTSGIIHTEQGSLSSTAHRAPVGHFVGWLHARIASSFFPKAWMWHILFWPWNNPDLCSLTIRHFSLFFYSLFLG